MDLRAYAFECSLWRRLVAEQASVGQFYGQFLEGLFVEKEQRELDLLTTRAEERLEKFKQEFAPYVDIIPKAVAASYIGVTPETFSRMVHTK